MIVSLLLLLSAIVSTNAQPAADKPSPSSISGRVTSAGKGASGVVVGLAIETPSRSIHVTRLRAVTDEEGNYRIKNVPPGTYQVMVAAADYFQNEGRVAVVVSKNEAVENINITLVRGGVITGRVTDADGRPVVEEQIFLSSTTATRGLPYLRTILTDDRGIYRAYGLAPGRYTVCAGRGSISSFARAEAGHQRTCHPSTVNAAEATVIEVNEGSEATSVDITLGRLLDKYTARGRIIDGDTSQPLPNARIGVQLFFANGSASRGTAVEATKGGEFKIENLPPGKYAVYLESQTDSESFSEPVRFEVIDQDIEGLLITTSKGATAAGILVLEGTQDPSVRALLVQDLIFASVSNEHYGRTRPSAKINPDGSFRLTGLPAGRLTLQLHQTANRLQVLRIERDGIVYRSGIDVRERDQITGLRVVVSQANGTIRGVLKLPEGVELPATVKLHVSVKRSDDPTGSHFPVKVDARGQFLVQNLVPGTYEFSVVVVGITGEQRPRILRPPETVVVTNGAIADVTIMLQMPKTGPSGP